MKSRRSPVVLGLLSLLFVVATWLHAAPAVAAGPDAAARALGKKAMEEDYLATEFDKAQEKLNKALAACGDKCTPQTRAILHRDQGVVFIGGFNNKDKGTASFVEALKLDPSVALDPDVKTKEIEAAFELAKKRAGSGGGGGTTPKTGGGGGSPSGDFDHTPVAEQQVRTPVPIYAEYTGSETIVKVMARYKGFGMTEYKPLELKKMGKGWGGTVPCADVGQQGSLQYYLQGYNDPNEPVAPGGDRNNPYKVAVKTSAPAEAPHLPDQPAPTQCADTGDCPPGFPCAKKGDGTTTTPPPEEPTGKPEGDDCDEGNECQSGRCKSHKCTAVESKSEYTKIWVGVGAGIDFVFLPGGDDVCKLDPKTAVPQDLSGSGYYCTTTDGVDYPNRNDKGAQNGLLQPNKSGKVNSGIAPGNIRFWISGDYGVTPNILIGVRLGFVTRTYPGKAASEDGKTMLAPIHAEARFTYLFGKMALAGKFAPMAFAAVGASEWDANVEVPVTETGANPPNRTVQAWATGGPAFVSLGGGIRFAPVPKRFAIMFAPLKLNLAFGGATSVLPSLQPELGVQVGF